MTSHLSLFLILIILFTGGPSVGQVQTKATEKRAAFERVMAFDREAKAALDRENKIGTGPAAEDRRRAYDAAATELAHYIYKWIPDHSSVEYLRELYRKATYLEYADRNSQAHALYSKCQSHPQITASGATFNNRKLADLLPERLAETEPPRKSGVDIDVIVIGTEGSMRGDTAGATTNSGSSSPPESGSSAATGSSATPSQQAPSSQTPSPPNPSGRPPF